MITGCGILPLCILNNKIYLLCGIETDGTVSDLGGRINKGETIKECAAREFYEESVGLVMSYQELLRCKVYKKIKIRSYVSLIIKIKYKDVENDYDKLLNHIMINKCKEVKMNPIKYNMNHLYTKCIYPIGYFELDKIKWISLDDLLNGKYLLKSRLKCLLEKLN